MNRPGFCGDSTSMREDGAIGVHRETVRNWVRQADIDGGRQPGRSSDKRLRLKELEGENFELRRANEILKSAATFFGAELDRRSKR